MPFEIDHLVDNVAYTILNVSNHALTIILNRPQVLNALHPPAHAELAHIFDTFAHDPDLWVAVITGAGGRAFCVGTDLKVRAKTGEDDFPETGFAGLTHRFDLDKPIIAAVNGLALGGGLEMMLAADIVIAADHAEFGFPEPKVGLAALGGGGIQRLTRQIPYKQAMGLLLTGSRINADEAQKWGLINQVVPAEHLQEAVDYWVADMLDCAPLALKATKQIAQQSLDYRTLEEALQAKYPAATDMENSADALEGPKAFAEKRKPCWRAK